MTNYYNQISFNYRYRNILFYCNKNIRPFGFIKILKTIEVHNECF